MVLRTNHMLLSGFRDINYARVQAARRYLAKCNEIFIVSDIKRVETDETIQDVIREHVESSSRIGSVSTPNICIICSHAAVCVHIPNIGDFNVHSFLQVFDEPDVEARWKDRLSQEDQRVLVRTKLQMQQAVRGEWRNERQFKEGEIR